MNYGRKRKTFDIGLILFVYVFCAIDTLFKGWNSIILLPISVLVLPIGAAVSFIASYQQTGPYAKVARGLFYSLTFLLLVAYVCTVGYGDSPVYTVFGFFSSEDSVLVSLSELLSYAAYLFASATFVLLVVFLIVNHYKKRAGTR
ncbi:MAG TPA: hypothetical protein VIQ80_01170, partial [Candidatus Saccharimonadales bacterium]